MVPHLIGEICKPFSVGLDLIFAAYSTILLSCRGRITHFTLYACLNISAESNFVLYLAFPEKMELLNYIRFFIYA